MSDRLDAIRYARRNKLGLTEEDLNWMEAEIVRLRRLSADLERAVVQNARATRSMEKRVVEAEKRCKPAGTVR